MPELLHPLARVWAMPDSPEGFWSGDPYAPKISYKAYLGQKANLAGILISAMLYGVIVVLFFQCTNAWCNPLSRSRRGTKWGMIAYTMAMFSFVTIGTAMNLDLQSISYIDNREFPGIRGASDPGPVGYQYFIYSEVINVVPFLTFFLNQWLADGFMLYRCYVIYGMNCWAISFPCLMYLASVAMGTALVYYQGSQSYGNVAYATSYHFGTPYYLISLSLNVLLTLMIVLRLLLHSRNIKKALGPLAQVSGLYRTVVTMLIESCALYAVSILLFIGTWFAGSASQYIFFPILAEIQVIASFLIMARVANWSALTSEMVTESGGSIHFMSQGTSAGGGVTHPDGDPMDSIDTNGKISGELGAMS